ncbi:PH domain-containing protein [Oceanithermus sp.]
MKKGERTIAQKKTFEPEQDFSGRGQRAAALLLMGLLLAYYTYQVSAGTPDVKAVFALLVFLVVAAFVGLLWLMPNRLYYALYDDHLEIGHLLGSRRILLENVRLVKPVEYALGRRSGSASLPGYYVGRFQSSLGKLTAYAGKPEGEGLLLLLNTGEMVLLTPKRAKLLREQLRRRLPEESVVEGDEPQS